MPNNENTNKNRLPNAENAEFVDNAEKITENTANPAITADEAEVDTSAKEKKLSAKSARRTKRKAARDRKREHRRAAKEAKKQMAITPLLHRPMICPPEASDHSAAAELWGLILRTAVIFFAVFGMSFTLLDALGFFTEAEGELNAALPALASFVLSALGLLCTLAATRRIALPLTIIAVGGAAAAITAPNAVYIYRAVINGVVTRLYGRGFLSIVRFEQPAEYGPLGLSGCVATAACLLCCIYALAYLPSLMRRARPIIPIVVTVLTLVPIFVYNLTSSNWGITMITAAFSGLICMCVYDGIFLRRPAADKYDTETMIFEPAVAEALADEPTSREERLRAKREAKLAKKEAKAAKRADRRRAAAERDAGIRSADEEISEYFSAPAKKKNKKRRGEGKIRKRALTPAERRAQKLNRKTARAERRRRDREIMGARRRAAAADRAISVSRASAGGFAGAAACGIALLILFIPALTTSGSFGIIESIDKKLDYYREYVTALLMGDDPLLDELAYEGNATNFEPRSTVATHPYYTGKQLFEVTASTGGYPIYLRGWVATDYDRESSSWVTATTDSETFLTYRELFGTAIDPSESMLRGTYSYIAPSVVRDLDFASGRYGNNSSKYALVTMQVNIKRTENIGYAAFLPSFTMRAYNPTIETGGGRTATALRAWGSADASNITYLNFFDGIYTGYKFAKDTAGYSAVAYITSMKNSSFSQNVAAAIAQFNADRLLIERDKTEKAESLSKYGSVQSSAGVFRTEETGEGSYTVLREGELYYTVTYNIDDGTVTIDMPDADAGYIYHYICTTDGEVEKKSAERTVPAEEEETVYTVAPDLPAIISYLEFYSDEQKTALSSTWRISDYYTRYVYDTYTATAGSSIISELTNKIISDAHVETVDYTDDGEEIRTVLPLDLSRAAEHNKYANAKQPYSPTSLVTDAEVYTQRHKLVMEIVNWLRENCTYTLAPTLDETEELDGVERFLTVTHEGYCVQFASSLALMLREAGIPARYVDGYIAADFTRTQDGYTAYVRDKQAHAWVEVWYDGIGWVQYEATPEYYSAVYEYASSDRIDTVTPGWSGGEDIEEEPDSMSDEELEALLRAQEEAERRAAMIRTAVIVCVIILTVAAVAAVILILRRRAMAQKAAVEKMLASLTAPAGLGADDRRALVKKFADELAIRLSKLGFEPQAGEFRADFAARVWEKLGNELSSRARDAAADTSAVIKPPVMTERAMAECFDIIAAAEFGDRDVSLSDEDLGKLPILWRFLELE